MPPGFDYFVLLAEMRTGSNFLEANLNALGDVQCLGEAYNPSFIGYPKRSELFGMTREERDSAPEKLIAAIRGVSGALAGFRYFHDHDARAFEQVIDDPKCAKIVLTRNPLDSYVSLKIAAATGQWKLTDVKRRKDAKAVFDAAEFGQHVDATQAFQAKIANRLQISGQTAYYLDYEDLQDVKVLNGLASWLGARGRLKKLDQGLKRQNPVPLQDRVENPAEMKRALAGQDYFKASRMPNFEPHKGPAVPSYIAATKARLLFMPIPGGPEAEIVNWLAPLGEAAPDALETNMNQKRLRQWKRAHPGHRSFTVLRHPLSRAHAVFCSLLEPEGQQANHRIREAMVHQFKLKLPTKTGGLSVEDHRHAFSVFLDFAQANMSGQTALGPDPALRSQSSIMAGFGEFALPDFVLREGELSRMLPLLVELSGGVVDAAIPAAEPDQPISLSDICDDALDAKAARVYQRDYMMFGFGPWRAA